MFRRANILLKSVAYSTVSTVTASAGWIFAIEIHCLYKNHYSINSYRTAVVTPVVMNNIVTMTDCEMQ